LEFGPDSPKQGKNKMNLQSETGGHGNCDVCGRRIKNAKNGRGPICSKKLLFGDGVKKSIRVEILLNLPTEKRFLVFSDPRAKVVVYYDNDGRRAICRTCPDLCDHIQAVKTYLDSKGINNNA
jgi:hypothetical protein